MVLPFDLTESTAIHYINKTSTRGHIIYLGIIIGIVISLTSLPFIYIDISVKATGITRPASERTEVKSLVSGIIDSVLCKEGTMVDKDAIILLVKDVNTSSKRNLSQYEISQRKQFIADLVTLASATEITPVMLEQLKSPLYREQASRFMHQKTDQEAMLRKANHELEINSTLAKDKVISQKELFDIQINQERVSAAYKAFGREQLSNWQQDLSRYRLELSQYEQQLQQINTDAVYYKVKAPVAGIGTDAHKERSLYCRRPAQKR